MAEKAALKVAFLPVLRRFYEKICFHPASAGDAPVLPAGKRVGGRYSDHRSRRDRGRRTRRRRGCGRTSGGRASGRRTTGRRDTGGTVLGRGNGGGSFRRRRKLLLFLRRNEKGTADRAEKGSVYRRSAHLRRTGSGGHHAQAHKRRLPVRHQRRGKGLYRSVRALRARTSQRAGSWRLRLRHGK